MPVTPMPASPFGPGEYEARMDRLWTDMAEHDLDALVASTPSDIHWLTGFDSFGGYQLQAALVRRSGRPLLWVHEMEAGHAAATAWCDDVTGWSHDAGDGRSADPPTRFSDWLRRTLPSAKRVGVDLTAPSLSVHVVDVLRRGLDGRELVDSSAMISELRLIKSSAELAALRRAAAHADAGMEAAHASIAEGVRELDVLTAIQATLNQRGSELPAMPHVVLSGDRTVSGHQPPGPRAIGMPDRVVVEVVGVCARYHANVARTVLVGAAPPWVEDACETVLQALRRCCAALGPGVAGADIDVLSREITIRFDRFRRHRVGYGLEASFPPSMTGRLSLSRGDPRVLAPGMVVAIAPYLYVDDLPLGERFAAVIGQDMVITDTGAERLGPRDAEVLRV